MKTLFIFTFYIMCVGGMRIWVQCPQRPREGIRASAACAEHPTRVLCKGQTAPPSQVSCLSPSPPCLNFSFLLTVCRLSTYTVGPALPCKWWRPSLGFCLVCVVAKCCLSLSCSFLSALVWPGYHPRMRESNGDNADLRQIVPASQFQCF